MRRLGAAAIALLGVVSCVVDRSAPPLPVVFDSDVAPILAAKCVSCHGDVAPAAGWSATSYLGAIACVQPSGDPAVLPADARAPVLKALSEPSHSGFATAGERGVLTAWVAGGAPAFAGTVHVAGIVDPRSPAFHGAVLRAKRWSQMLDASDDDACGRCHDGTPARPAGVVLSAPGATACTTCHDQPAGVLACGTCHGDGARASPPRDPCFFPKDQAGAHAVHVNASPARSVGLACSACHPTPGAEVISGLHGDGKVEVTFDPEVVPGEASFDPTTGACSVSCHDAGGARPHPTWTDTRPMSCTSCHASPPAGHWAGPCNECHAEANAAGTALTGGALHLNGRVDLGDGSGGCGACHGQGDDPWPDTGAHRSHERSSLSAPVACTSCHVVPTTVLQPGHLDAGSALIAFSGLAKARGAMPVWSGVSCSGVACHGAALAQPAAITAPVWLDTSGAASACGACHGVPPLQHTPSTSCGRSNCHAGETAPDGNGVPMITPSGLALHVNGVVDVVPPSL